MGDMAVSGEVCCPLVCAVYTCVRKERPPVRNAPTVLCAWNGTCKSISMLLALKRSVKNAQFEQGFLQHPLPFPLGILHPLIPLTHMRAHTHAQVRDHTGKICYKLLKTAQIVEAGKLRQ